MAFVAFVCIGLIAWQVRANFQADRERDQEEAAREQYAACVATNERRADAKTVAVADVESDREIWLAIDDLFDDGIPDPARTIIFERLDARQVQIDVTYQPTLCVVPESLTVAPINNP